MRFGFDVDDEDTAVACVLVYAVWRSRNPARLKITPDVWSKIERWVRASAMRSNTLPRFVDLFKRSVGCDTLAPRWMAAAMAGEFPSRANPEQSPPRREFLTSVMGYGRQREVLRILERETAYVIALVRERLERERPLEAMLPAGDEDVPAVPAGQEELWT
jgi:hypothetical protein